MSENIFSNLERKQFEDLNLFFLLCQGEYSQLQHHWQGSNDSYLDSIRQYSHQQRSDVDVNLKQLIGEGDISSLEPMEAFYMHNTMEYALIGDEPLVAQYYIEQIKNDPEMIGRYVDIENNDDYKEMIKEGFSVDEIENHIAQRTVLALENDSNYVHRLDIGIEEAYAINVGDETVFIRGRLYEAQKAFRSLDSDLKYEIQEIKTWIDEPYLYDYINNPYFRENHHSEFYNDLYVKDEIRDEFNESLEQLKQFKEIDIERERFESIVEPVKKIKSDTWTSESLIEQASSLNSHGAEDLVAKLSQKYLTDYKISSQAIAEIVVDEVNKRIAPFGWGKDAMSIHETLCDYLDTESNDYNINYAQFDIRKSQTNDERWYNSYQPEGAILKPLGRDGQAPTYDKYFIFKTLGQDGNKYHEEKFLRDTLLSNQNYKSLVEKEGLKTSVEKTTKTTRRLKV